MRGTIRVSELALWLRCRRRTYLQYEMGYDSVSRQAGIGTAFHTLIAQYHMPTLGFTEEQQTQINELEYEDQEVLHAMFTTYTTEVEEEGYDVGQETLAVESRLESLVGGMTLSGQIDHVYRDNIAGHIVVQDTKTVASFFETAQRDFQLMAYLWLLHESGMVTLKGNEMYAIEHNIVKRNKRTGRAKPPFIQRNRHAVSVAEVEKWGDMLAYIVMDYRSTMQIAEDTGLGATHPLLWAKGTNDCSWYCPFASICGMLDDPEADVSGVLETEYVKREEEPLNA